MLEASRPWQPSRIASVGPDTPSRAPSTDEAPRPETRGRVALVRGCIQNHLFRRVNEATIRVLRANGWEVVEVPSQGCCGALHAHAGRLDDARALARRNLSAFRTAGVEWIVANAAGCGATMREYDELFDGGGGDHDSDAAWFAERVRDVSELLVDTEQGRPRSGAPLPLRVAYDAPCHLLHAQKVEHAPLRLLGAIPQLDTVTVPAADECCGGAGIYGITHPDLAGRIGADKVASVRDTGAEVLATGNPGCQMQIGAGLVLAGVRVPVVHPVELLDESYRRAGFYAS